MAKIPPPIPTTNTPPFPKCFRIALQNRFTTTQLATYTSQTHHPTFVYGSLMIPSLFTSIASSKLSGNEFALQMTPAILRNHARLAVIDADFPVVVSLGKTDPSNVTEAPLLDDGQGSKVESSVAGFLVVGLTDDERWDVDCFEAGMYNLTSVEVEVEAIVDDDDTTATGAEPTWNVPKGQYRQPSSSSSSINAKKKSKSLLQATNQYAPSPATITTTTTNKPLKTIKVPVQAECYIWARERNKLMEMEEQEWTFESFLESDMGSGY